MTRHKRHTISWQNKVEIFSKMPLPNNDPFRRNTIWDKKKHKEKGNTLVERSNSIALMLSWVVSHFNAIHWITLCKYFRQQTCCKNCVQAVGGAYTYISYQATLASFSCMWSGYSAYDRRLCSPNIAFNTVNIHEPTAMKHVCTHPAKCINTKPANIHLHTDSKYTSAQSQQIYISTKPANTHLHKASKYTSTCIQQTHTASELSQNA